MTDTSRYAETAFERELAQLRGAAEGLRNSQLNTAAFNLYIARSFSFEGNGSVVINSDYSGSSVPLPGGLVGVQLLQ